MKLLYLTHRIPYPPNKGDKISSFNIMRYFASRHELHLGTFIDHPDDWQYTDKLKDFCASSCIQKLDKKAGLMGAARGLLKNEALSIAYYKNKAMDHWVDHSIKSIKPDAILMYSGCTGQFVYGKVPPSIRTVFNAEDVDSEKFRSYARDAALPRNLIYRREADKLLAYERRMAAAFDKTVFISEAEASLFKSLAPESAEKITFRTQGVNVDYFDPAIEHPNPYQPKDRVLVFVGAMDYRPNIMAVTWYVNEVLPHLRDTYPDLLFAIVGMAPTDAVLKLGEQPNVLVTGGVPDIRPYVQHALAACLPLTIARGIQNKALEAMAMEKTILATPDAMAGIRDCPDAPVHIARNRDEMITQSRVILESQNLRAPKARAFVIEHYGWDANLKQYETDILGWGS
ncbi:MULTISPECIES: TIGR03087 family PEP-CTERM/XrtA system glycosyltransferase [unclassified Iodidimonas]|uniref:TIGR03087 family PEP-CTERM/XrtA system glycosyltransferase n=1 Tax=unclassified Iodidimonas TaxID=2626145 RepID=UPI002482AF4B|nr:MULTISPECIES: TIGR03087 family PEP-CTERM/XrtA system glycosyltransferase [unclassified Iodidimonas]